MGYAAGPNGPGGRWWPMLLAGLACVGLVIGQEHQRVPLRLGMLGMPSDRALLARDAGAWDVRSVRLVYRDATGKARIATRAAPTALRHAPQEAWGQAFPGWEASLKGHTVTLTERPSGRPFTLTLAHGRVVLLAGQLPYGAVVLETLPFLGGTLPLDVRARLIRGVPVHTVAEAWRTMDAFLT